MRNMASARKITFHKEKLQALLRREPVFPACIELDITTQCPLECHDCPSTLSPHAQQLDLPFLDRLFGSFQRQTRGLLMSGGEPTLSPIFPATLKLARVRGVEEIAVVTNGANLDEDRVAEALLADATVVRISFYDWEANASGPTGDILRKIEGLRERAEKTGSSLHIGVSALTTKERNASLDDLITAVKGAGAHWIYLHPFCLGWGTGALEQTDQSEVRQGLEALRRRHQNGFDVQYCAERYTHTEPLFYESYYASHLLMVLGADGVNYLGTEVKYQPEYALVNLREQLAEDFLWHPARQARIQDIGHRNYPPQGGRHRALLYNDLIQRLHDGKETLESGENSDESARFQYPHIL